LIEGNDEKTEDTALEGSTTLQSDPR
jgi:hypothetical protein